jgi:hypothetical protein
MKYLWLVYACMLIVCFYFSGNRFERRVCGGGRGLWISRRRRPGTRWPRQAIYLLHTWILIFHFALFYYYFLIMHCFLYCYYPYIAIVGDLAPHVNLISSVEMTPLIPIQHPYIGDLMISTKVFGKLVVEPKTLGWEHSPERFWKCFQKPWSSIYSTEMFSKWIWDKWSWTWRKKVMVVL